MTLTSPSESVTPSVSRRSSSRTISVSVPRLGCVYQSPVEGRDERAPRARGRARAPRRSAPGACRRRPRGPSSARAPPRWCRAAPPRRRRRSRSVSGEAERSETSRGRVRSGRRGHRYRVPAPARGAPAQLARCSRAARRAASQRGPRNSASRARERALVGGAEQVLAVDQRALVVEDRRLHRALEEVVGVAAEELVERVLAGDVHGQAAPAAAGPAPHLAQRGDRAGERHDDRGVELADVDAQLERVGGDDRPQLAAASGAPRARGAAAAV